MGYGVNHGNEQALLARLERDARELARSNRELDDFAYIASHDLKEPLRGISNFATFLLEDYGDKLGDDGRAKLETMVRLSTRLDTLINDLLEFSRAGRTELGIKDVNLAHVLNEVLESLSFSTAENDVAISVPESLPVVRCDGARVAEILRNLISNAIKYNDKPDKTVEIGWRMREDGTPVFYVKDNGIGIPEKHKGTVFRMFKRLHARDAYGGGTGAGLTIVKKFVERHGGEIWFDSRPGEGSCFQFTLGGGTRHD